MASIQSEELVCPRPPCFKPLKFLGLTSRKDEQFVIRMDANASFKENDERKRRTTQERKIKGPKCSLLKFLEAKAQKKSQKLLKIDN